MDGSEAGLIPSLRQGLQLMILSGVGVLLADRLFRQNAATIRVRDLLRNHHAGLSVDLVVTDLCSPYSHVNAPVVATGSFCPRICAADSVR